MTNYLFGITFAAMLGVSSMVCAQTPIPLPATSNRVVTVIVEIQIKPGSKPDEALVALSAISTIVKNMPGFMSDEVLQNINPANSPAFLHVMHWAAINYWADVFRTPEFQKLASHSNQHYTITASAYESTQ
jgi:heme-degrading monooxygenase HmoA